MDIHMKAYGILRITVIQHVETIVSNSNVQSQVNKGPATL